jgi:AraC-like DNA-binding protein
VIQYKVSPVVNEPYHFYKGLTIIKILSGRVYIKSWGRGMVFNIGDIIILNNGELRQLKGIGKNAIIASIHISEAFCLETYPRFRESIIFCNAPIYEKVHYEKYQRLRIFIDELIGRLVLRVDFRHDAYVEEIGQDLVTYLCHHFDYVACGENLKRFSDEVVERNRWIYKNYFCKSGDQNHVSLKEITKRVGISYNHFRGDVIKRYGFSYQWLKYTIMCERAARLLIITDLSIMEIGLICGFSDGKYMIKYFREFYDCTPSVFRKQCKRMKKDQHAKGFNEETPMI